MVGSNLHPRRGRVWHPVAPRPTFSPLFSIERTGFRAPCRTTYGLMANDTTVRCVLFHHSSTSCNAYKPYGTATSATGHHHPLPYDISPRGVRPQSQRPTHGRLAMKSPDLAERQNFRYFAGETALCAQVHGRRDT
ncbi:MAG: hypothetical protein IJV22_02015 [Bacteroidales bacterium]|nr:hypothetical protein [Bacteroidales bacterium]